MLRKLIIVGLMGTGATAGIAVAQDRTLSNGQAQSVQVERPADLRIEAPADAKILRARDMDSLAQTRPVRRRMTIEAVRAQPVIRLDQGTADMRPILQNPAAPVNLAQRLRAQPRLATVRADTFEVAEIAEGLVVRQFLSYQLKPGACTTPDNRRAVAQQGIECFTRKSPSELASRFSQRSDQARFVADPVDRRRTLAEANVAAAEQQAEIDGDIAQLREYLSDPEYRGQIGAAEADRLAGLSDEDLQAEMLTRAEIEIEEVMFVPNLEAQDLRIKARPAFGTTQRPPNREYQLAEVSAEREAIDARVLRQGGTTQASSLPPARRRGPESLRAGPVSPRGPDGFAAPPPLDIEQDIAIDREIFLTGFTLGREHEWRKRVSITVKWCLFGCSRTYYIEPYAGFSYGFGLRFPLRMDGTYRYRHKNGNERASFVPEFRPINGNTNQYARAGLTAPQRFDGQELVAEARAYTGFLYKLTGGRQGNVSIVDVGVDLTDRLPSPFTGGQFEPPAPGETTPPVVRTIEQVDLLMGRAQYGVVGGRIHPAVKLELFSDGLKFDLRDHVADTTTTMDESGKAYPLAVNANHFSRFTVRNPVYNLGFQITPGLVGRAYVDISIWSRNWDWPVWFPQLKVQLPPNGMNFSCHAGTVCRHQYKLRADHWRPKAQRTNPGNEPTRTNPGNEPRRTNPTPRRTNPGQ